MNPNLTPIVDALKAIESVLGKGVLDYLNVLVVAATFVALVVYTFETHRLRKVAERQLLGTGELLREAQNQNATAAKLHQTAQDQNVVTSDLLGQAQLQNEIAVMPMFAVYEDRQDQLILKNVGLGPAFNLQISPVKWEGKALSFLDAHTPFGPNSIMTPDEVQSLRVCVDDGNGSATLLGINEICEWINTGKIPSPLRIVIQCVSLNLKPYQFEFVCHPVHGRLAISYERQSTAWR